jgi:hypothetical protein
MLQVICYSILMLQFIEFRDENLLSLHSVISINWLLSDRKIESIENRPRTPPIFFFVSVALEYRPSLISTGCHMIKCSRILDPQRPRHSYPLPIVHHLVSCCGLTPVPVVRSKNSLRHNGSPSSNSWMPSWKERK